MTQQRSTEHSQFGLFFFGTFWFLLFWCDFSRFLLVFCGFWYSFVPRRIHSSAQFFFKQKDHMKIPPIRLSNVHTLFPRILQPAGCLPFCRENSCQPYLQTKIPNPIITFHNYSSVRRKRPFVAFDFIGVIEMEVHRFFLRFSHHWWRFYGQLHVVRFSFQQLIFLSHQLRKQRKHSSKSEQYVYAFLLITVNNIWKSKHIQGEYRVLHNCDKGFFCISSISKYPYGMTNLRIRWHFDCVPLNVILLQPF